MRIVADANLAALDETFGRHGSVQRHEGRAICRADLEQADALLVRSITRVDAALLDSTPVRFVGSATIGTDHLDTAWLDAHGLAWASAPGCNADAAAQYTLAMLILACRRLRRAFSDQRVGIIGRGNVGSRLQALLEALDIPVVACDPPLQAAGEPGLVPHAEALAQPVVSLHVPLTRSGRWPTWRMLGAVQLAQMPPEGLLINAARGEVVDGDALRTALAGGRIHAALDTWPGEPDIDTGLLRSVTVATPHVAGYSVEGKRRGTHMIYAAFCRHFGLAAATEAAGPPTETLRVALEQTELMSEAMQTLAIVERDDAALRAQGGQPGAFDALRRDYPPRHEFRNR